MNSLKVTCLLLATVVLQSRPLDGAVFSIADLMALPADGTTPSPVDIPPSDVPAPVPEVITPAPEVKPPTPEVNSPEVIEIQIPPAPQTLPVPSSVTLSLLTSSSHSVRGLAVANNKLYVLSVGQSTGPVIEVYSDKVATLTPVQQFRLSDVTPRDLAVSADGTQLYVADERSRAVLTFDAASGARLVKSWQLQCTPDTLSITGNVLLAACGDNLVRLCYQDGSVKTSSILSGLSGVDHVVQLGNGQLAALVRFKATNKDAICVGNTQQGFSTNNCYQSGLSSPVYLAPVYGGYVLEVDQAAGGTLRIYGPGLESGLSVSVPSGLRGLPAIRRVVVDLSRKLIVVAYSSKLAVFTATINN